MQLEVFKNKEMELRTAVIKNEPYFMLKDVCKILGIMNSRNTVGRLLEGGVVITDTPTEGGMQKATFINEQTFTA